MALHRARRAAHRELRRVKKSAPPPIIASLSPLEEAEVFAALALKRLASAVELCERPHGQRTCLRHVDPWHPDLPPLSSFCRPCKAFLLAARLHAALAAALSPTAT